MLVGDRVLKWYCEEYGVLEGVGGVGGVEETLVAEGISLRERYGEETSLRVLGEEVGEMLVGDRVSR